MATDVITDANGLAVSPPYAAYDTEGRHPILVLINCDHLAPPLYLDCSQVNTASQYIYVYTVASIPILGLPMLVLLAIMLAVAAYCLMRFRAGA